LKESVTQLKNNFLLDGFLNLKKMIFQITQQVQGYIKADSIQINKELNTIEKKINTLQESKSNELKISIVKDLILDTVKLVDKINTSNIQELLKNNLGNIKNISEDVKVNLLLLKEVVEKNTPLESQNKELKVIIDKTLSSIDYYQLSSFSSNANHSFLAFMQDELENVDIKFNNQKDEFSCMITLSLKEYGDLKVLLVLDEKSELSINIGVEQEEFKKMIQISLQKLRAQINDVGLLLVNLNVFDINNEKSDELKAYGGNTAIDFGLDMKV
ncbi:MAG: flagellar hook-length control protein FliK, partial [Arcobacteraceae bacterium]